ncbi:hypothetical protein [Microbulbifer thermotolerans]|uniref:hypothetical protein n=1 Tax=Microbulbifer thermotolerans TaxID=252514 RepID=UPI00224B6112|nr:hypothetical protein [Microbulbifer thermotolerans]MCX2781311.1 hypothetical protein [Microbulbifer thermotolerans]MCX2806691.1 hypothetical protein [Microbulbifer thermotolerans]MCX2842553.1 hypothetical protein [Microbulbifer thermotolerans]
MARYSDMRRQERQRLAGLEIFEITPVILGGDPIDPQNKITLTRVQHIEAVRYWNKVIKELREKSQ